MTPDPKVPTTTHSCFDGVVSPGKGRFGKGADRCARCFNEYCKELRQKRKELGPPLGTVSQMKINRGHDGTPSTTHGFYRKKLGAKEAMEAERLEAAFYETYDLDRVADAILVHQLVVNIVKSLRPEPDLAGDHNVRDYQAYYERNVRDAMAALGLNRKERKDDSKQNDVMSVIQGMFNKRAGSGGVPPPTP